MVQNYCWYTISSHTRYTYALRTYFSCKRQYQQPWFLLTNINLFKWWWKKRCSVWPYTKTVTFHNADGSRAEPVITIKIMTACSLSIFKDVAGSKWALYLSTPQPTLIIHLCSLWKDFSPPIQNSLNPGHGQQMHMRVSANVKTAHKLLCYGNNLNICGDKNLGLWNIRWLTPFGSPGVRTFHEFRLRPQTP